MNELLSKQGQSVTQLSQLLIQLEPSDRLPSIQTIASEQGMSVGTVQAAMQYLQTGGIIDVESRGRLGAFVRELDYIKLWKIAYSQTMIGILPMPYSKRIEGLATSLRDAFDAAHLNVNMRFMRGSTARIQRLHAQQCDWVMTSRYALETAQIQGFDVEILLELGSRTFTVDHVMIIKDNKNLQAGMRVGIDTHSADHAYVVRLISRGVPVTFVDIDYSNSIEQLLNGDIDATVWTEQDLPVLPENIYVKHLSDDLPEDDFLAKLGEAVVIGRQDSGAVANVLHAVLDVTKLRETQNDILQGKRRPTY